ncbi:MAG: hypothetical protein ACKODM_09020, partial [Cytophagales bacterium]
MPKKNFAATGVTVAAKKDQAIKGRDRSLVAIILKSPRTNEGSLDEEMTKGHADLHAMRIQSDLGAPPMVITQKDQSVSRAKAIQTGLKGLTPT